MLDGQERRFGLSDAPFSLTANPKYLVESRSHVEGLEQITRALRRHEPLVVITGEPGTGKTMLCRMVATRVDPQTVMALITTPPTSFEDLLRLILDDFGVFSKDSLGVQHAGRFELLRTLRQFLASLAPLNLSAVVIVDEAHRLSTEMLEELRALTNLETHAQKLLQIVLVGEPTLDAALSPQFVQRVTRRHELRRLDPSEVRRYIERRLTIAHGHDDENWEVPFTLPAIDTVAKVSGGVPRVINVLCDRALEKAAESGAARVDRRIVHVAAEALHLEQRAGLRIHLSRRVLAAAVATLIVAATALGLRTALARRGFAPKVTNEAAAQPLKSILRESPPPPPVPAAASPPPSSEPERAALGQADSFAVVVSSFHTPGRALAVVDDLKGHEFPAFWRAASGWEQVLVGPYASRQEASIARERLVNERLGEAPVISNVKGGPAAPAAEGPALLTPGGRVSIWLDTKAERIDARSIPSENDRMFAVQIGPLATPLEPRTLVAAADAPLVENVKVLNAAQVGGAQFTHVIVTARAPIVGKARVEGHGVYIDLDPRRTGAPRAEARPDSISPSAPATTAAAAIPAPSGDWKGDVVRKANALAARPDVKGLLELRAQAAARASSALSPEENETFLAAIDAIVEQAQKRQLKVDALLFASEPKNPKAP